MQFSFHFYGEVLDLFVSQGYHFSLFGSQLEDNQVFLRHDIDLCLDKALLMAKFENAKGIHATYFVLVTSMHYNIFHQNSKKIINKIAALGHDIGLHFDLKQYEGSSESDLQLFAEREKNLLSSILTRGEPVKSISVHTPTRLFVESELVFPTMTNVYLPPFFVYTKYVSDSARHWKEDIRSLVGQRKFSRFQLLVHPFWYNEKNLSKKDTQAQFICKSVKNTLEDLGNLRNPQLPALEELICEQFHRFC